MYGQPFFLKLPLFAAKIPLLLPLLLPLQPDFVVSIISDHGTITRNYGDFSVDVVTGTAPGLKAGLSAVSGLAPA